MPFMDTAVQGAVQGVIFHHGLYNSQLLVTTRGAKNNIRYSYPRVLYYKHISSKSYMK